MWTDLVNVSFREMLCGANEKTAGRGLFSLNTESSTIMEIEEEDWNILDLLKNLLIQNAGMVDLEEWKIEDDLRAHKQKYPSNVIWNQVLQ